MPETKAKKPISREANAAGSIFMFSVLAVPCGLLLGMATGVFVGVFDWTLHLFGA